MVRCMVHGEVHGAWRMDMCTFACIRVCMCMAHSGVHMHVYGLHLRLGRGRGEVEDEDVEDVGELRELLGLEVRRLHVLGPAVSGQ